MEKHEPNSAKRIARAAVYDMLEGGADPADVLILVEEATEAFLDTARTELPEHKLRRLRHAVGGLGRTLDGM